MARKTIFISDLTGNPIDDKNAATVTIKYADARKGQVVLDVNADEVAHLAGKGTKQARRGRRPKELPAGPRPIEAVGTSTAAFVGTTPRKRSRRRRSSGAFSGGA
jgi:hypothetical protein